MREILQFGCAAVLAANDVVDFVGERGVGFVDQAVFAATLGALKNLDKSSRPTFTLCRPE